MFATQMFGAAAEDLLPLLRQGSAGLRRLTEESARYGLMTDKGRETARDFAAAQTRIGLAVEGLGGKIAERLVPVLIPLLDKLSGWITTHGDNIAAFFGRVADGLTRWVDSGGVQDMLAKLESFGAKVDLVVHAFGGWEVAATGLGVVLATKLLSPLTGIVTAMGVLGGMKPSPWMLKMMGVGGGAIGLAMDLSGGKTDQDRYAANTDSMIAQLGKTLGEKLGMSFDGEGKSEGLLSRWFGGGRDTGSGPRGMTPGEAARGGTPQSMQITPGSTALPRGAGNTQAFVDRYGPMAQRVAEQTGISARSILGQLYQETGGRGDRGNNPFNIQAGAGYGGQTITRGDTHADGTPYQTQFRAYKTLNDAGDDYAALLKRRYGGAVNSGDDTERFARGLKAGGYAEDPNYVANVVNATRRLGPALPPSGVPIVGPTFGPPMPGPAAPGIQQAAPAIAGRVAVDVTHRGDPGNTGVRVTTSGAAEQDRLRIERAPLLMGIP